MLIFLFDFVSIKFHRALLVTLALDYVGQNVSERKLAKMA